MSFDKIFDLTAGVYFHFYNIYIYIYILTPGFEPTHTRLRITVYPLLLDHKVTVTLWSNG